MRVAIVHDYLTQRGGAERVVLSMLKAFPDAPVYTAMYEPTETFPEFGRADVRVLPINRLGTLRRHHRWALPLLARSFSRLYVDADVAICSSSGWAHGARVTGRKIVYCHSPAKWLYRVDDYARRRSPSRVALAAVSVQLKSWDRRAALSADRYLANSEAVRQQIATVYSIDADVLPAPTTLGVGGEVDPVVDVEPGYFLAVSRLLPYKNTQALVSAFAEMPEKQLIVVGVGPETRRLRQLTSTNIRFLGAVSDARLRWLYANSSALISAAHEDYGLTPLEAASFGKPAVVLRKGGFLDTVLEGRTGIFFNEPTPVSIRKAALESSRRVWDARFIAAHAAGYSESGFVDRLRSILREVRGHLQLDRVEDRDPKAEHWPMPASEPPAHAAASRPGRRA
jgi:glycosyltransferase involved in cell wall biosynthesis